jgi:phage terminase large subunit-like protein
LGADADSMDGLNIHGRGRRRAARAQERAIVDVLETATGARRQPLINYITTAGYDRHSVCWQQHDYGVKVLEDIIDDDTFFAYIATIDEEDDWRRSVASGPRPTRTSASRSSATTSRRNAARRSRSRASRTRSNVSTSTSGPSRRTAGSTPLWDEANEPAPLDTLYGRLCYGGLDLASTTDIAALELWFPDEDALGGTLLSFFWVPEENIRAARGARSRALRRLG